MEEQKKQTRFGPLIIIAVIVLAAVVIWAMLKRQPAQTETAQNLIHQEHTQIPELPLTAEDVAETAPEVAPKTTTSLKDLIRNARSWQPSWRQWYGQTAPDFTLTDITGKEHKLSDYRGKDVLLVFWATWCGPCRMEIPHLIALRNVIDEEKLAIFAISNEKPDLVKDFAASQKLNYTVFSTSKTLPLPYSSVTSIPSSFFIDPEGKIKLGTTGALSLGVIKAILQAQ